MDRTKKTLMLGIDAACWEYIDPLIKGGRLPNLEQLISEGISGYLRSTIPPITSVAWYSLITGVNPGKHGIYDWGNKKTNSMEFTPVTATRGSGVPFWTYLNKSGVRVGLFNVPMIYPAKEINGFMVTGLPDTPQFNEKTFFPTDLYHDLKDRFCGFYVDDMLNILKQNGIEDYFLCYKKVNELNTRIAIDLIKKYDVDIFLTNYLISDHLNHFAQDFSYVERAYEDVDSQLGAFRKYFPDANFIIFSDHGSRRIHKTFLINKWLYEKGFLILDKKKYRELTINDLENVIAYVLQKKFVATGLVEKLIRKAMRYTTIILKPLIWKRMWAVLEKRYPELTDIFLNKDDCDLSKTTAFCSVVGNIYFNKTNKGDAIIDTLKAELSKIRIEGSDRKLFSEVNRSSELYYGDKIADAPDILTYCGDSEYDLDINVYNFAKNPEGLLRLQRSLGGAGDHTKMGILIMSGYGFVKMPAEDRINASIMDVVPTLFALYDVPLSKDFDGKVLLETFSNNIRSKKEPKYQEPIQKIKSSMEESPEDIEKVISRLKALGYL